TAPDDAATNSDQTRSVAEARSPSIVTTRSSAGSPARTDANMARYSDPLNCAGVTSMRTPACAIANSNSPGRYAGLMLTRMAPTAPATYEFVASAIDPPAA